MTLETEPVPRKNWSRPLLHRSRQPNTPLVKEHRCRPVHRWAHTISRTRWQLIHPLRCQLRKNLLKASGSSTSPWAVFLFLTVGMFIFAVIGTIIVPDSEFWVAPVALVWLAALI